MLGTLRRHKHSVHSRNALKNFMYQTSWWLVSIWGNLISSLVRAVRLMDRSSLDLLYLRGCTSRSQLSDYMDTLTWNDYPWFKKKSKATLCLAQIGMKVCNFYIDQDLFEDLVTFVHTALGSHKSDSNHHPVSSSGVVLPNQNAL